MLMQCTKLGDLFLLRTKQEVQGGDLVRRGLANKTKTKRKEKGKGRTGSVDAETGGNTALDGIDGKGERRSGLDGRLLRLLGNRGASSLGPGKLGLGLNGGRCGLVSAQARTKP